MLEHPAANTRRSSPAKTARRKAEGLEGYLLNSDARADNAAASDKAVSDHARDDEDALRVPAHVGPFIRVQPKVATKRLDMPAVLTDILIRST